MPHLMFDRDDLELLMEVAESGSLITAAKILRVHHAAAFRRLGELEKRAGVLIFERRAQGYVATAAARKLVASARRLWVDFQEFDARALELGADPGQPLKVTTSDGLASAFVPPLLRAFNDAHPSIVVDLIVENRVLNVSEREVDVALRPARQVSGDMVCRKVGAVGYSLYASVDYVRRHDELDAAHLDFDGHAICSYHESISYFTTAKWLEKHARQARIVTQCNSLTSMQALARTGLCIAALPCMLGDADSALIRLLPPVGAMETSLWICTHTRLRKVPHVRAFLDFFYAAIAKEQPRLAGRVTKRA